MCCIFILGLTVALTFTVQYAFMSPDVCEFGVIVIVRSLFLHCQAHFFFYARLSFSHSFLSLCHLRAGSSWRKWRKNSNFPQSISLLWRF